jgi:hypothetical protein
MSRWVKTYEGQDYIIIQWIQDVLWILPEGSSKGTKGGRVIRDYLRSKAEAGNVNVRRIGNNWCLLADAEIVRHHLKAIVNELRKAGVVTTRILS